MPFFVVKDNRIPKIPRTPPTPMYSDDDHSSDSGEYNDYRDRDYRHTRYNYGQAWQTSRQASGRGRATRGREADDESDRESSEPTVSGFEPTYEQVDRSSKAILANDQDQLLAFKTIQAIHPAALEPYGFLPKTKNPRTGHFDWLRRTPKGVIAMVWCRINNTASDVVFEVTLHTDEVLEVHVPLDSWHRKTCDPEAVRASIQQAYLNLLRGHDTAVIVKPGMKSLRFITQHEYEDICYSSSSSSSSSSKLSRHQRSQSQRLSYQVPFSQDRRPAIHLSSPPPPRPHHQQSRPTPSPAHLPHSRPQPQPHQPQPPQQQPYHHRSRSQSQVLSGHQLMPSHHAQPLQVFSSPLPSPSPYTAPPVPLAHHQANYKSTVKTPLSAQPAVFPSRPSRTAGYY